jgi:hypothetical protein
MADPAGELQPIDPERLKQLQLLNAAQPQPTLSHVAAPPMRPMGVHGMDRDLLQPIQPPAAAVAKMKAYPGVVGGAGEAPDIGGGAPVAPSGLQPVGTPSPVKPLTFAERQKLPLVGAPGSAENYQSQLARIADQKANPLGTAENHPGVLGKIGHALGKVGNIAGDIFAPATMGLIPGTDLNRRMQEHGLESKLGQAETREGAQKVAEAKEQHEEHVDDTNETKLDQAQQKIDETENKDKGAREVALRKQGLKTDDKGMPVPLAPEDMSENERAVHDLKVAQADAQTSKAMLDKIKADPNSPQSKALLERVRTMAKNADTAAGKLGLDKDKFRADYFGLDKDGNPLAGTATDEKTGKPIGPRVANSSNSSADRIKRSDLARNVEVNLTSFKELVKSNPNLFGKIAGRFTTVQQMVGSDDPEIARAGVMVHNAALASNGAHGVRSAEAVKQTEDELLNHFRNGVDATVAAADEMIKSVSSFREDARHGKRPDETPIRGTPTVSAAPGQASATPPKTAEEYLKKFQKP